MGDTDDCIKTEKTVFVTVGTTCFDALVKAVDTQGFKSKLSARGYTRLLIQMGRGSYIPTKVFWTLVLSLFLFCFIILLFHSY